MTIIAGTGHRPQKLGGFGQDVYERLVKLAERAIDELKPSVVISGMALGWDQALALASIARGTPCWAYVPFSGQERVWPEASRDQYDTILRRCAKIVTVSTGGYAAWKMQRRNEQMVDDCTKVLALWDGTSGGTANCVRYAEQQGKPIVNIWEEWSKT